MELHPSKRDALIHLINSGSKWTVQKISELSDGKLFCIIIQQIFPEIFETIGKVCHISVNFEEQLKEEELCNNVDFQSDNHKMICEDAESEKALKKDSGTVKIDILQPIKFSLHDNKSAVLPSTSAGESVSKQVNSAVGDEETVTKSTKSVASDSKSVLEPVESTKSISESLTESVESENYKLVINRYRLIQYFIDVKYEIKSETVIAFPECWKQNELELAKVLIFIMAKVVYHIATSPDGLSFVNTIGLVEDSIQEELHHCFKYFLPDETTDTDITREEVEKILCSSLTYNRPMKLRSHTIQTPPKEKENKSISFTPGSPLKTYFDSPVFKRSDMLAKEREIFRLKQLVFEEEFKKENVSYVVEDLKMKLKQKDKEIYDFKMRNRMLQKMEISEDCENCIKLEKIIEENQRHIKELEENRKERDKLTCEEFEKTFIAYQVEVAENLVEFHFAHRSAEKEIREVTHELEKTKDEKKKIEKMIKDLSEAVEEKAKELDLYKEKLACADRRNKEPESPVLGECMGRYFKEEEEKSQLDESEIKLEVHPKEKSVNHVMVQVSESKTDVVSECQMQSDVLMTELPVSNDLPECENIDTLKKSFEDADKECSDVHNVSNKLDTTSKQYNCSDTKEVASADNSYPSVTNDGIGSLWHQFNNSISENENENNNYPVITNDSTANMWHQNNNNISENENGDGVPCADNGLTKALSILQKTEYDLNEMTKHFPAISKVSSGPNGSNGIVSSPIIRKFLEELKKSVQKSLLCLSQTGESQIKFQNNNSISKIMLDEAGSNADAAVFSKCFECSKVRCNLPNKVTTADEDNNSVIHENTQEIDSLKEKYKESMEACNLKEKELEHYKKKYSYLKSEYQENLRNTKEIHLKYQKLEIELKEARKRENDFKRETKKEKNILKTQIRDMGEKWKKLQSCVLSFKVKIKDMSEENKRLREEISSRINQNEELSSHIKQLENQIKGSNPNVNLDGLSSTTRTSKKNKDLKVEDASYDSQKPECLSSNLNEVASEDNDNENSNCGALNSKSLHKSGIVLFHDDEDVFLNCSSLTEIGRDITSSWGSGRASELAWRNSQCPHHLKSVYPAEVLPVDPTEFLKCIKDEEIMGIKPGYLPGKNAHIGMKRKLSEIETKNQSSQLLATPVVKTKKRFLQTPTSLKKWRIYRRNQRSGSIKPKP